MTERIEITPNDERFERYQAMIGAIHLDLVKLIVKYLGNEPDIEYVRLVKNGMFGAMSRLYCESVVISSENAPDARKTLKFLQKMFKHDLEVCIENHFNKAKKDEK